MDLDNLLKISEFGFGSGLTAVTLQWSLGFGFEKMGFSGDYSAKYDFSVSDVGHSLASYFVSSRSDLGNLSRLFIGSALGGAFGYGFYLNQF